MDVLHWMLTFMSSVRRDWQKEKMSRRKPFTSFVLSNTLAIILFYQCNGLGAFYCSRRAKENIILHINITTD